MFLFDDVMVYSQTIYKQKHQPGAADGTDKIDVSRPCWMTAVTKTCRTIILWSLFAFVCKFYMFYTKS